MSQRQLGKSGLSVSTLCLGGNVFGWTIDEPTSFSILDAYTDAGLNFVDTADMYSAWVPGNKGGESETIIGSWFKSSGKRNKVVLATKVGNPMGDGRKGLKAARIVEAVEESLTRLQTDYIDLYQAHVDDESTPLEESLEAFNKLIQSGKVRAIGASNYKGARLQQAIDLSKEKGFASYQSLQPHYNLANRKDYETDLEPVVLKNGIGVIPYFSLASGFLTGKYRSVEDAKGHAREGGVSDYLNERGFAILKALDQVAAAHATKPAVVALAWLIARPSITAPISSATKLEQLKDLIAATQLTLSSSEVESLTKASAY